MIRTMVANWFKEQQEEEQQQFREWLKGLLHQGTVEVEFTKKDGTARVMKCTLKHDLVKPYEKKTDKTKPTNEEVCPVFDLDKQEWRSFKYDTVTKISSSL